VGDIVEGKLLEKRTSSSKMYNALKDGHKNGIRVIAELKAKSPDDSDAQYFEKNDIPDIVKQFESEGVSAISVLVEPKYFNGSYENLKMVREITDLPLLAKGFFVTLKHLAECKAAGADAYLLMTRVIDAVNYDLKSYFDLGKALEMEPFIEANSQHELEQAMTLSPQIVEINNRNIYSDLSLNLKNASLGKEIPENVVFVSASGIENANDIKKVYENSHKRVDAVLVGTSVMKSTNITAKVKELVDAGKEVVN
jgi:indole-3-glycerol phosphate synthase